MRFGRRGALGALGALGDGLLVGCAGRQRMAGASGIPEDAPRRLHDAMAGPRRWRS